jgi:hypothetical protein
MSSAHKDSLFDGRAGSGCCAQNHVQMALSRSSRFSNNSPIPTYMDYFHAFSHAGLRDFLEKHRLHIFATEIIPLTALLRVQGLGGIATIA